MEWQDVVSNDDLKPKVEVTGRAEQLTIRIGRDVGDRLQWKPGAAKVQYAQSGGRSYVRLYPDQAADWSLRSAGKGGGFVFEAVQLAPATAFEAFSCSCEITENRALVVSLPEHFSLANEQMVRRKRNTALKKS